MNDASRTSCGCFFFNDTATTEIYTLSLHDALPILTPPASSRWCSAPCSPPSSPRRGSSAGRARSTAGSAGSSAGPSSSGSRSEEHTSELQSRQYPACRLLLGKKKTASLSYTAPSHL